MNKIFFNGLAKINSFEILIRNISPFDNHLYLNNETYNCMVFECKNNATYYVDFSNHSLFKNLNLKRSILEIPASQMQMPFWKLSKSTIEKIIEICYE